MRLLFQGDSITDAFRRPDEINPAFQLGNGYVFLLASGLACEYPHRPLVFLNRGVSGNRVADLKSRWREDAHALRPDVLTLLVGVNDTLASMQGASGCADDQFEETYQWLIDSIRSECPRIRLVLMEPFLLQVGDVEPEWRDHLAPRRAAIRRIARASSATFIPLQEIFDTAAKESPAAHWSYDGIHPTHAGFQLIANNWKNQCLKLL
jgi:lysophospholipase L1-like esterase